MNAVIKSEPTRVKVNYNDASQWTVEEYFYRDHVSRIALQLNQSQLEIVRIYFTDGQYLDIHFSVVENIQTLADATPVTVSSNQELLLKLLEIKDE